MNLETGNCLLMNNLILGIKTLKNNTLYEQLMFEFKFWTFLGKFIKIGRLTRLDNRTNFQKTSGQFWRVGMSGHSPI